MKYMLIDNCNNEIMTGDKEEIEEHIMYIKDQDYYVGSEIYIFKIIDAIKPTTVVKIDWGE